MIAKRMTAAWIAAATVLTAVAAASPAAPKQRMGVTTPKESPTHFAGVPPKGVKASTPTTGKLMLGVISQPPRPTTTLTIDLEGVHRRTDHLAEVEFVRRRHGRSRRSEEARHGLRPAAAHPPGCATTPVEDPGDRPVRARPQARSRQGQHSGLYHQVRRGDRLVTVQGIALGRPDCNAGPDA